MAGMMEAMALALEMSFRHWSAICWFGWSQYWDALALDGIRARKMADHLLVRTQMDFAA